MVSLDLVVLALFLLSVVQPMDQPLLHRLSMLETLARVVVVVYHLVAEAVEHPLHLQKLLPLLPENQAKPMRIPWPIMPREVSLQHEPAAAAMDVAERRQATADMMIWLARERLSSLVENGLREKDRKREN